MRNHCVKSVQIRSFFWSIFSRIRTKYGEILQQNTDRKKLRIWTLFTQWMSIKFCALEMFNSAVFVIFDFRLANINFAIFQIVSLIWFLKFYLHLANEVNHLQKFLLFIKQINWNQDFINYCIILLQETFNKFKKQKCSAII